MILLLLVLASSLILNGCTSKDINKVDYTGLVIYEKPKLLVLDKRDCQKSLLKAVTKSRKQTVILKAYEKDIKAYYKYLNNDKYKDSK